MATYEEHFAQAKHNEEIADLLLNPDCCSHAWVTIITFYAALQFIEAAFTRTIVNHLDEYYTNLKKEKGEVPGKHTLMQQLIEKDLRLRRFADEYRDLRVGSEAARYLRTGYSQYFNDAYVRQCFEINLQKIKCELNREKLIDAV